MYLTYVYKNMYVIITCFDAAMTNGCMRTQLRVENHAMIYQTAHKKKNNHVHLTPVTLS